MNRPLVTSSAIMFSLLCCILCLAVYVSGVLWDKVAVCLLDVRVAFAFRLLEVRHLFA